MSIGGDNSGNPGEVIIVSISGGNPVPFPTENVRGWFFGVTSGWTVQTDAVQDATLGPNAWNVWVPSGALWQGPTKVALIENRECGGYVFNQWLTAEFQDFDIGAPIGPYPPFPIQALALDHETVLLTWHDRSNDEDNFLIVVTERGKPPQPPLQVAANSSQSTVIGLTESTEYYFEVIAKNNVGATKYRGAQVTTPAPASDFIDLDITARSANSPLCMGAIPSIYAYGLFDDGIIGRVDSELIQEGRPNGDYPVFSHEFEADSGLDFEVVGGDEYYYDSISNRQAGAVIRAHFASCGFNRMQIATIHFELGTQDVPMKVAIGDAFDWNGEVKGVLLEGSEFDNSVNYDPGTKRLTGFIEGQFRYDHPEPTTPAYWTANARIDFDVVLRSDAP